MLDFAGRGALVTGGASGIGLATARALARRGMRLVLCDQNEAAVEAAAAELRGEGAEVLGLAIDVTDRPRWAEAALAVEGFGRLHLVCANAGIAPSGQPLWRTPPEAWDRVIGVNLTGVFNTVHALVPLIRAHGEGGHLVLTSSMAGMLAVPPIGDYAVAKFGVGAMGEVLRAELAADGIGVSVLYPGVVATPLVGESRSSGMAAEAIAERLVRAVEADEMFVFTHADYRPLVERRLQAIRDAFAGSADAEFREGERVLAMMRNAQVGADG